MVACINFGRLQVVERDGAMEAEKTAWNSHFGLE
jgi:hypothetical protein